VQGSRHRSLGRPYQAYEEFLKADDQLFAHDIAVFELAPEVVVRGDFDFMIKLFEPLDSTRIPVQQWEEGGKVATCLLLLFPNSDRLLQLFTQYAYAMQRIPDLITEIVNEGNGVPDAEQREECEKLMTVVLPRLMNTLPRLLRHSVNIRHRAALDDMLSSLVLRANALDTLGTAGRRVALDMSRVESGARLRAVHAAAFDRFCKTVEIEISA
jgi:nuclear pore complex protein Nup98-Nup96